MKSNLFCLRRRAYQREPFPLSACFGYYQRPPMRVLISLVFCEFLILVLNFTSYLFQDFCTLLLAQSILSLLHFKEWKWRGDFKACFILPSNSAISAKKSLYNFLQIGTQFFLGQNKKYNLSFLAVYTLPQTCSVLI